MGFLSNLHGFMTRNAAVIVSTCSLCVAVMSLIFTIDAQQRDASYKEISIVPLLQFESHSSDYSFNIVNQGVGVAEISKLEFELNGKCYSSDQVDMESFEKARSELVDTVAFGIYLNALSLEDKEESPVRLSTSVVSSGTLIRPGQKISLFWFEEGPLKDALARGAGSTKARNAFMSEIMKLPIRYEYCSITGLYCSYARTENIPCKRA